MTEATILNEPTELKAQMPSVKSEYDFTIEGKPDYAFVTVNVPADKVLKVEASAMATMDTNMQMKTGLVK